MAHSFGGVKKIIVVHIEKKCIKVGGECGPDWESEGLMLRGGDEHGHMWRVACVCAVATHNPRRVGVYWILMGCLGKTLSLSLFFYLILCQACGLLSCEDTASIKDLFISLFRLSFASWCEKSSFTGPCSLTPTHPNLSVTTNWA